LADGSGKHFLFAMLNIASNFSQSTFHHLAVAVSLFFTIRYFRIRAFKQRHLYAIYNWLTVKRNMLFFLNISLAFNYISFAIPFYKLYQSEVKIPTILRLQYNSPELFIAQSNGLVLLNLIFVILM
jgi:hypothetical protein